LNLIYIFISRTKKLSSTVLGPAVKGTLTSN